MDTNNPEVEYVVAAAQGAQKLYDSFFAQLAPQVYLIAIFTLSALVFPPSSACMEPYVERGVFLGNICLLMQHMSEKYRLYTTTQNRVIKLKVWLVDFSTHQDDASHDHLPLCPPLFA